MIAFVVHLFMSLKELLLGWHKKIVAAVGKERRLKKTLTDFAMFETICVNVKVLEILYVSSSSKYN